MAYTEQQFNPLPCKVTWQDGDKEHSVLIQTKEQWFQHQFEWNTPVMKGEPFTIEYLEETA
jgi:hypothetical protein